jgi:hypothetical protein
MFLVVISQNNLVTVAQATIFVFEPGVRKALDLHQYSRMALLF